MATDPGISADKTPAATGSKKASSHTVKAKDTFESVATEHGVSVADLLAANEGNLKHTAILYVGDELKLPKR